MNHALFEIVSDTADALTIRDVGHNRGRPSVTNDVETVVATLAYQLGNRRLYYYDSDGNRDEIYIARGKFAGFRPARSNTP